MKTILVTGDPTCDHNFYKGNRHSAYDGPEVPGFLYRCNGGGVHLLRQVIEATVSAKNEASWQVVCGLDDCHEKLPWKYHALCLWENCGQTKDAEGRMIRHWHPQEPQLGYGDAGRAPHSVHTRDLRVDAYCPNKEVEGLSPEIIVIDDAATGFRDLERQSLWPNIVEKCKPWIVVKLTGSLQGNALWNYLAENFSDRLIGVLSSDALRKGDVRLSYGLSWEAVAEDIVMECNGNPLLADYRKARHLFITVRTDAAFWLDNRLEQPAASIVFDPAHAENEWGESQPQAGGFGYLSCFTASLVRVLCASDGNDDQEPSVFSHAITHAMMAGLAAGRTLHTRGHVEILARGEGSETVASAPPDFPYDEIASCQKKPHKGFAVSPVPLTGIGRDPWMMLDDWQINAAEGTSASRPHYDAAFAVAMHGVEAMRQFPYAQFGKYISVDRHEIESLRTFRLLIRNYLIDSGKRTPLNLGVFGPPGSGKSFVVVQIAEEVLANGKHDVLLFNLSQFNDPSDLLGALHQVRDKVLSGSVPVVFWDEFDAENYKWLQYMLAPMEDGSFQDGQITHPIGRCIFVFAGATSYAFNKFGPLHPDQLPEAEREQLRGNHEKQQSIENSWRAFVLAKGPDFKSRLVGYLDILGVNRRLVCREQLGVREWFPDEHDVCFPIRRALFIRALMGVNHEGNLEIQPCLLNALLEIEEYKLGGRSLQFLCGHFKQSGQKNPGRASLPGHELLDMHVEAQKFRAICERDMALQPLLEKLAPTMHEGYRQRSQGNPEKKELDVPFDELREDLQQANIRQAQRIPGVLRSAGLRLEPGPTVPFEDLPSVRTPEEEAIRDVLVDPATLEMLAEAEHNGWMVERMSAGFRYSPVRIDSKKRHDCLIPYSRLSESVKDYDRNTITGKKPEEGKPDTEQFGYVDIVKLVGLRVVQDDSPNSDG